MVDPESVSAIRSHEALSRLGVHPWEQGRCWHQVQAAEGVTSPPTASERKAAAKRHNERVKLFATSANTIGLGIFAVSVVGPSFGQTAAQAAFLPWWAGLLTFVGLHCAAQAAYSLMKPED